jgi:hypothetical protein
MEGERESEGQKGEMKEGEREERRYNMEGTMEKWKGRREEGTEREEEIFQQIYCLIFTFIFISYIIILLNLLL